MGLYPIYERKSSKREPDHEDQHHFLTRAGAKKNLELGRLLSGKKHQAVSYSWHTCTGRKLVPFQSFEQLMSDLWREQELFLVLTDVPQAVRILGPYLQRKGPAIFSMDEAGRFVIPFSFGQTDGMEDWCTSIRISIVPLRC